MKFIKWKSVIITCFICLSPILLGLVLWNRLPDAVAVHFDMYNNPDNYAPKAFAVFRLPCMMALLQIVCCIINDINAKKYGTRKKFERVTKGIIPVLSVVLQCLIFGIALGRQMDIRRVVMFIVGVMLIVLGNYLPKFDYVKGMNADVEQAKKINRFIGFETVIMGILGLITIFLQPVFSIVWLILLIFYGLIGVVYGIKVTKSGSED